MKISYNWLRDYLDTNLEPDKVAELLTGCGLEVESTEGYQSVKGGLKGIVIGKVLTCRPHPNSDHLSLTTVDIGTGTYLNIVCGAPNVAEGQKVAVATIGTTLFLKDKEIILQRSKIRGEVSEGMICAEDELGLGTSHDGIMILDREAPVGTHAATYFGITEDVVFTIGLTPNRTDATSHLGVARDLAAVINNQSGDGIRQIPAKELRMPDVSAFGKDNNKREIGIVIEDPVACPRYTGLTITGIKVKDSPAWLQNRLLSVGLRPINNIVDVTNFVLMELGQPLHAFDCDKIAGNKVIIKKPGKGTKFITLDGIERELTGEDLMICNAQEPMCIAGVFGGVNSGVTTCTTSVFLESAYFDPQHIRRTSRYHGLQTDASFRFERGADYDITEYSIKRAALLIRELAGGEISSDVLDVYPAVFPPRIVKISYKNIDRLIGKKIGRKEIYNILNDIGIRILSGSVKDQDYLELEIPAFKADVTREADVIEEILRIYGYNNVEIPDSLNASLSYTAGQDGEKIQNLISDYLSANGFHEIMNNSLTRSGYYREDLGYEPKQMVRILNPISRDLDVMRISLIHGAMESLVYNLNRQQSDLRFFEFGNVYTLASQNDQATDELPGYHEEQHLSMLISGQMEPSNWNNKGKPVDFYEIKSYTEAIFRKLSVDRKTFSLKPFHSPVFKQGLKYFHGSREIATVGSLNQSFLRLFDCRIPVYYAELNWSAVVTLLPEVKITYRQLPRFPEVRRDLALLLDDQVSFSQIEELAFRTERKMLRQVGLFDVFEGDKIGKGKKSYAVSFIFRDDEKTLTDKEIEKIMGKLIKAFSEVLDARIR